MEKIYDVTALGEMLIDFAVNGESEQGNQLFEACPGGAPCNVLAMLNKLGRKTAFIGKVGNDQFGKLLRDTITNIGIEAKGLVMDQDIHTTLAFVHTFPDGDREFSFYRKPGADMMLKEEEVDYDLIRQSKVFHFGTLSMTDEPVKSATKKALADGNYVYNGSFQEGTGRMKYWEVTNKADADISVTDLEDGRRLKVTSAAGTEDGKVLVGQSDLALGADKEYVLSFSAQADEAKTMIVTVAGDKKTFDLTTEKKTYSIKFKTAADLSDKDITFDLGLGTTVYLDDVRIDEDALIKNGNFNAGLSGFEAYCYTPSNVTYVVDSLNEDNAADFTIKDTGNQDWHIQLKQTGVNLEKGQWYRISMKMKSSIDRKVSYALQRDGSVHKNADGSEDWTPYSQKTVDLTGEYQTFTQEFKMTEDTDPGTIFNIAMGAVGGTQITEQHRICIDDIVLEKIDAPEIKPEEAGKNLLKNADFSDDTNNWNIWAISNPAAATSVVSNGAVTYNITNVGTEDWNVQLKQEGITLEKGCKYRAKFKVTSTAARTIKLAFLNATYAWYGGADISLTANTEKEVVCEFTVGEDKETDTNIDMVVSMGKISEGKLKPHTITMSDFSLVKVAE